VIGRRLVAAALLALAVGCGATASDGERLAVSQAVTVANGARLSIETVESTALLFYRQEQIAAMLSVRERGGTAEDAANAVRAIRERWDPLWRRLDEARTLHALLVAAVQAYETGREVLQDGTTVGPSPDELVSRAKALQEGYQDIARLLAELRGKR
jgi:hypothetical protein